MHLDISLPKVEFSEISLKNGEGRKSKINQSLKGNRLIQENY